MGSGTNVPGKTSNSGERTLETVDGKRDNSRQKQQASSRDQLPDDGVPYDDGWAWMVVLAGFVNFVIASGYNKATFIFFVRFLREFRASVSQTALFFGVKAGVNSVVGLFIMNAVVGRLGTRRTVLAGGLCLSVSAILGSLGTSVTFLICTQAVFHGLGMAMLNMPTTVLIGFYFRRRRSLANSIAKCGVGVGSVAFPPLITYLLGEYGLRGSMLLAGGICLHTIACAALLRPTSFYTKQHARSVKSTHDAAEAGTEAAEDVVRPATNGDTAHVDQTGALDSIPEDWEEKALTQKDPLSPAFSVTQEVSAAGPDTITPEVCEILVRDLSQYLRPSRHDKASLAHSMPELVMQTNRTFPRRRTFSENDSRLADLKVAEKKSVLDAISNSHLNKLLSMPDMEDLEPLLLGQRTSPEPETEVKRSSCLWRVGLVLKSMVGVLDFSLFASPMFRVLSIFFLLCPLEAAVTTYMPAMAQEQGLTENQAAILLSIIGGLDFCCRLGSGFLADLKVVRVSTIICTGFSVLGVVCQFTRFLTTFPLLVVLAAAQGLLGGVAACLLPILIMEDIGVRHTAKALGFSKLFSGAVMAAFHPLLGYIRDSTGSYDSAYHVIGVFTLMAAGVVFCIRFFRHELPVDKGDNTAREEESMPLSKEKV